jgi:hypothetical protein
VYTAGRLPDQTNYKIVLDKVYDNMLRWNQDQTRGVGHMTKGDVIETVFVIGTLASLLVFTLVTCNF